MRVFHLAGLIVLVLTCGSLGEAYLPDEVAFSAIERSTFDALAVIHEREAASDAPLTVRVHVVGDATQTDLTTAFGWLAEHANVHVVLDPAGVPLYLTGGDLAATSGRGTLGATVPEGMAVEARDARVWPCVVAHELLHFVGLKHVDDDDNIMYPHCSRDFLEQAEIAPEQLAQLATLDTIRATTPAGVVVWASR